MTVITRESSADVVADRLLQQHCSLTGVLAVCVYMSDIKHFATVNSIYVNYFSAGPPARYSSRIYIARIENSLYFSSKIICLCNEKLHYLILKM